MFQNLMNRLNDLRPRQLLILAGCAAFLMFLIIYAVMNVFQSDAVEEAKKKAVESIPVVVAKVNIPPRTRIQESMLQLKEMPIDAVPEGVIKSFADVLDVQVKVSIFAGDILTIQKVFSEKTDEGFIATIPLDCRAVSISVNDITSVAGFAKPGDFVDLILVEKSQYSVTSNVLLQNVQLLSINKDMTGTTVVGENGVTTTTAINNPSIATFALHPEDVLKVISASKLGEIYMSLRPTKPKNSYGGEMEYTIESINTPPPEPEYPPAPRVEYVPVIQENPAPAQVANPLPQIPNASVAPAVPSTPKIEIIQGDQITQKADEFVPSVKSSSLPMIPSGRQAVPSGVEAPVPSLPRVRDNSSENFQSLSAPVSDTPLSNSRVAQSFGEN